MKFFIKIRGKARPELLIQCRERPYWILISIERLFSNTSPFKNNKTWRTITDYTLACTHGRVDLDELRISDAFNINIKKGDLKYFLNDVKLYMHKNTKLNIKL